mgnify:CR=1 FL=1
MARTVLCDLQGMYQHLLERLTEHCEAVVVVKNVTEWIRKRPLRNFTEN